METLSFINFNMDRSMHDPDMGNWNYYYDANGNMTSQLDSMNQWIYFQYDALNRLKQKDYSTQKALGSGDIVYRYDETHTAYGKGRLTSMQDQSVSGPYNYNSRFYYDSLGEVAQLDKVVDGVNYTTAYGYDQLGRPNAVTYPDNSVVNYNYNGPLLNSVYEGSTTYAAYSGYNALGQPGSVAYNNNLVTTTYTYNNSGNGSCPKDNYRLCSIYTTKNGLALQNMLYDYDNVGNITSITDHTDNNQNHENDKIARLNALNSMTYGYPTNGIRPHAATSAGSNSYAYDNNGNMTTGAGRGITYDPENRPSTINAGGTATSFYYDGNGERVKKAAGSTATVYINGLYECTGGTCTKYIFANGQRIAAKTASNTYYYHPDHLGGSSVVTDTNGNEVEYIAYYPFGQTRIDSGTENVPYKYTGQELDGSTGLYNYSARLYDPVLGKFITADSIVPDPGDPQAFNRYSYVRNNPINLIDPSGHSWFSDSTGVDIDFNRETSRVVHTNLGINSIGVGYYAGYGGEANFYFTDDGIDVGGGIGLGAGGKLGISTGSVDIAFCNGAATSIGYDPYGGLYVSSVAGFKVGSAGLSASYTYYPNSGNYQVGIGESFGNIGIGVGYSNIGGTSINGGYGGLGANYSLQSGTVRYLIDPMATRQFYRNTVGYDVTLASGGDAVQKGDFTPSAEGANNIGTQGKPLNPNGWFNEGGIVSRFANRIPGINAVAGMHDMFQVGLGNGVARNVLNVPGMIPAAIITYSSFLAPGQ